MIQEGWLHRIAKRSPSCQIAFTPASWVTRHQSCLSFELRLLQVLGIEFGLSGLVQALPAGRPLSSLAGPTLIILKGAGWVSGHYDIMQSLFLMSSLGMSRFLFCIPS